VTIAQSSDNEMTVHQR